MTSFRIGHFQYSITAGIIIIALFIGVRSFAKNQPIIANDVEDIHFSCESGFYDKEFDLQISATGGTVYYTLDGSEPSCETLKYEAPIHITDASENENFYAMITDVSLGLQTEVTEKYGSSFYCVPNFKVDKCTVVRAVIHYGENRYSRIKTASYFVGFDAKSGYDGMNVISLVTDPDNLFGYENGIYVIGQAYNGHTPLDDIIPEWAWWFKIGNYTQRGKESERIAELQFFDANGDFKLSQNCGIRIHGGGSRGYNPKSLNLYARKEYNGKDYFPYDFFENGYYADKLTLTQGGDDYHSKLRDYLMNRLMRELPVSTMEFSPCVLFLDGEYWGVYWLTEKYDKQYISYHYNVDADNVIMIKNGMLEEGEDQDFQLYSDMANFCSTADMTKDNNYQYACKLLDIDSFIDYFASMTYAARCLDWPSSNFALWRSRNIGTSSFDDGKWRWMVFDLNSAPGGLAENFADYDAIENAMDNFPMFANLMKNEGFRKRFTDRCLQLGETIFAPENVERIITEFRNLLDEPMRKNQYRFYSEEIHGYYVNEVNSVAAFFQKRKEYIPAILERYR